MKFLKSSVIAFSMYSHIPMPKVEWTDSSMAYALCFFPAVGLVSGALLFGLLFICEYFHISYILRSAMAVALPVIVSGAIHLDGFCDTADALSSHADREKKLEILKDPNAGAFAVIACVLYLLIYFALFTGLKTDSKTMLAVALIPVLSRSLSGMSAVCYKNARSGGLLAAFSEVAQKRAVRITLSVWIIAVCTFLLFIDVYSGMKIIIAAALSFIYYTIVSYRQFGGITGDLAGWFLQICELLCLASVVF